MTLEEAIKNVKEVVIIRMVVYLLEFQAEHLEVSSMMRIRLLQKFMFVPITL